MKTKRTSVVVVIQSCLLLATLALACHSPTAEDERRLTGLRDKYPQSDFEPDSLYLRLTGAKVPSHEEAAEIWRYLVLDDEGKLRSDCSFVYLNVYDQKGTWKGQYYLDNSDLVNVIFEKRREYY